MHLQLDGRGPLHAQLTRAVKSCGVRRPGRPGRAAAGDAAAGARTGRVAQHRAGRLRAAARRRFRRRPGRVWQLCHPAAAGRPAARRRGRRRRCRRSRNSRAAPAPCHDHAQHARPGHPRRAPRLPVRHAADQPGADQRLGARAGACGAPTPRRATRSRQGLPVLREAVCDYLARRARRAWPRPRTCSSSAAPSRRSR